MIQDFFILIGGFKYKKKMLKTLKKNITPMWFYPFQGNNISRVVYESYLLYAKNLITQGEGYNLLIDSQNTSSFNNTFNEK